MIIRFCIRHHTVSFYFIDRQSIIYLATTNDRTRIKFGAYFIRDNGKRRPYISVVFCLGAKLILYALWLQMSRTVNIEND